MYYESRQSGLGVRFYQEVLRALDWIALHSATPRLRRGHRRVNLPVFPYYIAYLEGPETIEVFAVAHAHRLPDFWRRRKN